MRMVSCHSRYLARMGLNLATVVFERSWLWVHLVLGPAEESFTRAVVGVRTESWRLDGEVWSCMARLRSGVRWTRISNGVSG
jgi:hypothetical protein